MSSLHPMRDYLLVKRDEAEEATSQAGIITAMEKELPRTRGVVLKVGPGAWREGQFHKTQVAVGSHIVFRDSFQVVKEKVDGVEYLLMPETEVIALLDDVNE